MNQDSRILSDQKFSKKSSKKSNSNAKAKTTQLGDKFLLKKQKYTNDCKKDFSGQEYLIYVLDLLSKIREKLDSIKINDKFYFSHKIHSEVIQNQILKSLNQQQEAPNLQLKNLINQWPQYQQPVQLKDIKALLKTLTNCIQKENASKNKLNINGDFDIYLTGQNVGFQKQIERAFQNLGETNKKHYWLIPNYLSTGELFKENQQAIHVFQVKKNPFRQDQKDEENFPQQTYQEQQDINQPLKSSSKSQNSSIQAIQTIKEEKVHQNPKKISQKPIVVVEDSLFKKTFLEKLNKNNMLKNIAQIIKLVLGTIYRLYQEDEKSFTTTFNNYRSMRSEGKISFEVKIQRKSHPRIILYYILNSRVTQKQFEQKFNFFKPILKHIFKFQNAVLNIIGYTPIEEEQQGIKKKSEKIIKEKQDIFQNYLKNIINDMQKKIQDQRKEMKKERQMIQENSRRQREEMRKQMEQIRKEREQMKKERDQMKKQMQEFQQLTKITK